MYSMCLSHPQLQNQDSVKTLLKRTETELSVRVADALRKQEDPLQRQRLLVEEERLKYLNEEELIIQQLQSVAPPIINLFQIQIYLYLNQDTALNFMTRELLSQKLFRIIFFNQKYCVNASLAEQGGFH